MHPFLFGGLFAVGVFVVLQAGYAYWNFSVEALGKVFALESVALLSLTFLIGSLARFWPVWAPLRDYRKALGLLGFVFAAAHVLVALYQWFGFDFSKMFSSPKIVPILVGWVAFLIFSAMAVTSGEAWMKRLGMPLWSKIQAVGYVALALVAVHFFWMEIKNGIFKVKPLGQAVLALAVVTLLAKTAAMVWRAAPHASPVPPSVAAKKMPKRVRR